VPTRGVQRTRWPEPTVRPAFPPAPRVAGAGREWFAGRDANPPGQCCRAVTARDGLIPKPERGANPTCSPAAHDRGSRVGPPWPFFFASLCSAASPPGGPVLVLATPASRSAWSVAGGCFPGLRPAGSRLPAPARGTARRSCCCRTTTRLVRALIRPDGPGPVMVRDRAVAEAYEKVVCAFQRPSRRSSRARRAGRKPAARR